MYNWTKRITIDVLNKAVGSTFIFRTLKSRYSRENIYCLQSIWRYVDNWSLRGSDGWLGEERDLHGSYPLSSPPYGFGFTSSPFYRTSFSDVLLCFSSSLLPYSVSVSLLVGLLWPDFVRNHHHYPHPPPKKTLVPQTIWSFISLLPFIVRSESFVVDLAFFEFLSGLVPLLSRPIRNKRSRSRVCVSGGDFHFLLTSTLMHT